MTVEITDDGPAAGPAPARSGGYGLIGMRERVEALGGTLHAGPTGEIGPAAATDLAGAAGLVSPSDPAHPAVHSDPGGWTVRAILPVTALPVTALPAEAQAVTGLPVSSRGAS